MVLHDLQIKQFGQGMNLLHICAHYEGAKLLSVAWLPVGQIMMGIFTCIFWLAAAVFCQLDTLSVCVCMCLCLCVCMLRFIAKHTPVPFAPQAHAALALATLTVFIHKHTLTIRSRSFPIPCPHYTLGFCEVDKQTRTYSFSSIEI